MTVCSCESRETDTTKPFTGESSLTGSIVQTWAATAGILLREKQTRKRRDVVKLLLYTFQLQLKKKRRFIGKLLLPVEYRDFHLQNCYYICTIFRAYMTYITSITR